MVGGRWSSDVGLLKVSGCCRIERHGVSGLVGELSWYDNGGLLRYGAVVYAGGSICRWCGSIVVLEYVELGSISHCGADVP